MHPVSFSPHLSQHGSWTKAVHRTTVSSKLLSHSFLHLSIRQALTWGNRLWHTPHHASSAYLWLQLWVDGQIPAFWQSQLALCDSQLFCLCAFSKPGNIQEVGNVAPQDNLCWWVEGWADKYPNLLSFREFGAPCNAISQGVSRRSEPHCSQW